LESQIILASDNKEELNKLIDGKLKEGYLIKDGIYEGGENKFNQVMILPNNIDAEFTLAGGVKLIVGMIIYAVILYFVF